MTTSTALPISVFIIARDEADRIGRALAAVAGLAAQIVVVDSGSGDDTVAIAERHGAEVIHHDWSGYGPQKRFAESQCRHDWLLNLDADEVVPPTLAEEIRALFAAGQPANRAYEIPIAEMFPVESEPHRFAYTLYPVRLYHREAGSYSESPVHDRVVLQPGIRPARLNHRIHHLTVRSLGAEIVKLNAYSDMQIDDLDQQGRRLSPWRILTEFPVAFAKAYFGRRHFVRGLYGVATAVNFAFSRHLRVAKHLERRAMRRTDNNE